MLFVLSLERTLFFMPDIQDIFRLQAFVTVVEEGSITSAVNKLHITQPALSTRLKLLEEGLGCQLLERMGRGVRPTPIGKLVYSIAADILNRMSQLQTTVRHHIELREGFVHLGGGATAVSGVFPEAIYHFRKEHPNIQFTLKEQDSLAVIEAIRDGAVDIGIVTKNPNIQAHEEETMGLKVHAQIFDDLVVIGSKHHPLVRMQNSLKLSGKSLLPMHLNKQPMILFDENSAIRKIIDTELQRCYVKPKIVMTIRSVHSMLRMVQKNIGLSIVSKLSVLPSPNNAETLAWDDMEILKVEGVSMKRILLVVSNDERSVMPVAEVFLKKLCEMFAKK
jgi:DNA-binding transcriptional LysR family regulator